MKEQLTPRQKRKRGILIIGTIFLFLAVFLIWTYFSSFKGEKEESGLSDGVVNVQANYKNIKIKPFKEMEDVKTRLESEVIPDTKTVTDGIQNGDFVTMNYVTRYKEYEEDKIEEEFLEVGNNDFPKAVDGYQGFDEQLIGHKIGDKFTALVAYPEDEECYEAQIDVEITSVEREEPAVLTDAWVEENTNGYHTVEEYISGMTEELTKEYEREKTEYSRNEARKKLLKLVSIEDTSMMKELVNDAYETQVEELSQEAEAVDMLYEDYINSLGETEESLKNSLEDQIKCERACALIAEKEKIDLNGEEFQKIYEEEKEYAETEEIDETLCRAYVVLDWLTE